QAVFHLVVSGYPAPTGVSCHPAPGRAVARLRPESLPGGMRGLPELVVAHGREIAAMSLETAADAPAPGRDVPAEARDVVAAARRQAAHLLLEILVAGGALRRGVGCVSV